MYRLAMLTGIALLGACGGKPPSQEAVTEPRPAAPAAAPDAAAPAAEEVRAAPHGSSILLIALTDAGDAAMTVDLLGLLRLWPSLDGTREPLVVRAGTPRQIALGRDADQLVAGLLDPAGGLELLRFDAAGAVRARARVFHDPAYEEIAFSAGAILARARDHTIAAIDADGRVRGRLIPEPGQRITGLAARGRAAIAAIADGETADARAVRRIELAGGVRWGATLALPAGLAAPIAISPGGGRLAGFHAEGRELTLLELEPRPRIVQRWPSTQPQGPRAEPAALGFLDDETLVTPTGELLSQATAELSSRPRLRLGEAPAIADRVAASGHRDSLILAGPDATWYLGYRLSPIGFVRRAGERFLLVAGPRGLWLDERLQIQREAAIHPAVVRSLPLDARRSLDRVSSDEDERRGVRNTLVDHDTGRRDPLAPDPGRIAAYESRTRILASVSGGTVRRWRIDLATGALAPAGRPLRARRDASIALLDPAEADGAVVIAYDDQIDVIHVETFVERDADAGAGADGKALAPASRAVIVDEIVLGLDRRGALWTMSRKKPTQVTAHRQGRAVARFAVGDVHGGAVDPGGGRVALFERRQVIALDAEGREQWRSWITGARAGVFSEDGRTLLLSTAGGMVALDAADGRELATSCGWAFGRSAEEPSSSMLGAAPVCAEGGAPP